MEAFVALDSQSRTMVSRSSSLSFCRTAEFADKPARGRCGQLGKICPSKTQSTAAEAAIAYRAWPEAQGFDNAQDIEVAIAALESACW